MNADCNVDETREAIVLVCMQKSQWFSLSFFLSQWFVIVFLSQMNPSHYISLSNLTPSPLKYVRHTNLLI